MKRNGFACIATLAVGLVVWTQTASAQSVADFYKGKTLELYVGYGPGGGYDQYGRLLARHIGKYIPGKPDVIVRNMPGAGSAKLAAYMHEVAPKDGLQIGAIASTVAFDPLLGNENGENSVKFDPRTLNWLGSMDAFTPIGVAWHTSGIKTIEDAKKREVILGAPGANTPSAYNPLALNALVGTKFKLIVAYPGGNDVNLALERGEVEARHNIWASWVSGHPEWLKEKKIVQLVQIGLVKHRDLPDVPLMMDLAKNPEDRAALKLMSSDVAFARPFATTPGVPAERVAALRRAFDATMKDADLLAECAKANRDLSPSTGEQVQAVVLEVLKAPAPVLAKVNTIITQAETLK